MKYRFIAFVVLSVMVVGLGGSTFADSKRKKAPSSQLLPLLPASDGVVVLDVKRFFGDAMPKVLANNQPILARVTAKIDEAQARSGIDIRQFDDVVVGVNSRRLSEKKYDIEPVIIARGQVSTASMLGASKLAANGKYSEERIGDRTMYVFDVKDIAARTSVGAKAEKVLDEVDKFAVAALDDKTLAFGDVNRVRSTLEGKTSVGADLTSLLSRNPNSVASFAAKPPAGLKEFVPLENDELGKNIDAIRYLYGSAEVDANGAGMHMTARTQQNLQAKSLHEALSGLQVLGKAFLGGAKAPDKQVYRRLVENVKFTLKGNEVSLDLQVAQSDVDLLVGQIKVKE